MGRNLYNLGHLAHLAGHIGRIQTISVTPVIPGDSIKATIDGIMRLAPTRKEVVSECQVDICAFYVKHRHVLGNQEWVDFLRSTPQTANPFTGVAVAADYRDPFYLGIKQCGATVNKALLRGYNFIYARYFMVPASLQNGEGTYSISESNNGLDYYPTNEGFAKNYRRFGALAARLPHILNGANILNALGTGFQMSQFDANDWGVLINDTTPNVGLLDIRDLAKIQARFKTVTKGNWYAQFYNDVLQERYHTKGVNTDADKRPDYLGRVTINLSGHDVDGTADATLGSFIGKTLGRLHFNMNRRFFPEHGNLWLMMVPRFPLVHTKEQHPLLTNPTPNGQLLAADPALVAKMPPVNYDPAQWLAGGSVFTPSGNIVQPYGQEYRYQTHRVHPVFEQIPGYPFSQWDSTQPWDWYYYRNNEYADTFQTSQVAQWQAHLRVDMTRYSSLPSIESSIFAGA